MICTARSLLVFYGGEKFVSKNVSKIIYLIDRDSLTSFAVGVNIIPKQLSSLNIWVRGNDSRNCNNEQRSGSVSCR